jgi:hypothetical protein
MIARKTIPYLNIKRELKSEVTGTTKLNYSTVNVVYEGDIKHGYQN